MGLSHSEIRGSTLFCSSPRLFAALHVLHRLSVPRHPPCALSCLLINHCAGRPATEATQPFGSYLHCALALDFSHSRASSALARMHSPARPRNLSRGRARHSHAAIGALATSLPQRTPPGSPQRPPRGSITKNYTIKNYTIAKQPRQQKRRGASRIRTGDPLLARQVL
jgi:hypothetical protein